MNTKEHGMMKKGTTGFSMALASLAVLTVTGTAQAQMLDTTKNRVQTTLAVTNAMPIVGTLEPRKVGDVKSQQWMVGCETLDRGFGDYNAYKEYLVPLGIGRIRLQSGWASCEREPGKYDFRWLDRIVRDAHARGLEILLTTSYGNPIYPGGGNRNLGGGFPTSETALKAWDKWVETMALRYKGIVRDYEMWNEPDGNKGNVSNPNLVADVDIRTAEVIKRVLPDARISGGVLCWPDTKKTEDWLKRVTELKKEHLFTWFAYHGYTHNPDKGHYENVEKLKALFAQYAPNIKLWQAEAGVQSEYGEHGALSKYPWTELTQAKWDTRRMLGDLGHDVWSSVFTIADLCPNRGKDDYEDDVVRYGLLKTDENLKVVKVKPAYYAVQNVVSVFDGTLTRITDADAFAVTGPKAYSAYLFAKRDDTYNRKLLVLWDKTGVPSDENATHPVTVRIKGTVFRNPVWVDLITGHIHTIPDTWVTVANGDTTLINIPIYDAPVVIGNKSLFLGDHRENAVSDPNDALASYRAEWAALRPKLDADIERYRKGDAVLELVDADGKPVTNATLTIRQKPHAFLFGCNILPLGQLGELNAAYEEKFVKLFNLATTTFCWGAMEPEQGQVRFAEGSEEIWRRPPPDRVLAFCKKHGIAMKGQPLMAGSWHPKWAPKDPEQTKKLYREWFAKVAERYGDDVAIFDVVNESQCHRKFCLYTPELEYVGWAFKEAQTLFPNKTILAINEATPYAQGGSVREGSNVYYNQLKNVFAENAGVDAIGFQFHMFSNGDLQRHLDGLNLNPKHLLDTYDAFGKFGKPLFITEITVPSTLGTDGEALQAEVSANLYRLWFSVPAMAGITWWNLCDGAAWGGTKGEGKNLAGLIDDRMREKPVYQALYQLIRREWNTQVRAETDAQGKAAFRGFYGTYDVVAVVGDKPQTFDIVLAKDAVNTHKMMLE